MASEFTTDDANSPGRIPVASLCAHLAEGCFACQEAGRRLSEPIYLMLNCPNCYAPMAIDRATIDHGLKAGWKCGCGTTSLLSEMAVASEFALKMQSPAAPAARQDR